MTTAAQRFLYAVLALAVLAGGFVWLNDGVLESAQNGDVPQGVQEKSVATVAAPGPGEEKVVLQDLGMTWMFCRAAVAAKLKQTPGVMASHVDLESDSATVLYDPDEIDIAGLKQAVAEAGYRVKSVRVVEQ